MKLINNMVLFQNVVALAEALSLARKAGLSATRVFDALSKGSADSFALRNHGMKAMLPDKFPGARLLGRVRAQGHGVPAGIRQAGASRAAAAPRTPWRRSSAPRTPATASKYFPVLAKTI